MSENVALKTLNGHPLADTALREEVQGLKELVDDLPQGGTVTDEQIIDCAEKLQAMGGRNVLVSLAGDGALLLDEQGMSHRIGCPKGKVVNSVGAGDSMVAGFLAGVLQTGDYAYALKLGTAAGSATAFSLGLADRTLIESLLATL